MALSCNEILQFLSLKALMRMDPSPSLWKGTPDYYFSGKNLPTFIWAYLFISFQEHFQPLSLLIQFKLVFGQSNMHHRLCFCPKPARKKINLPRHKRSYELTVRMYIYLQCKKCKWAPITAFQCLRLNEVPFSQSINYRFISNSTVYKRTYAVSSVWINCS